MNKKNLLIFSSIFLGATSIGLGSYILNKNLSKNKKDKYIVYRKKSLNKSLDFINNLESIFVEIDGKKRDYPARYACLKDFNKGKTVPAKINYDLEKGLYIVKIEIDNKWIPCGFIKEEVINYQSKTSRELFEILSDYKLKTGTLPEMDINLIGVEGGGVVLRAEIKFLNPLKEKTSEVLEDNIKKVPEIDKEEATDDFKVEENKKTEKEGLVYSSFFQKNIKKEYAFAISRFIDNNDSRIFKYVTKFVFDENGEFDYEMLKQLLTERYNNIKNIVKSEIMEMPSLTIFPLERYLNEIDTLKESNIDDRVDGILSYWVTVAESLSVIDII